MLPFSEHRSPHLYPHPDYQPPHARHDSADDLNGAPYAYMPNHRHSHWAGSPSSPHDSSSVHYRSSYVVSYNPHDAPPPDECSVQAYTASFGAPCTNYAGPPYNFGAYPCIPLHNQCPTPPTAYASLLNTGLLPDASVSPVDRFAYLGGAPNHYYAYDRCSAGTDSEDVSSPVPNNGYHYEGRSPSATGSPLPYDFQYMAQATAPSPPQSTFSELRNALREPELPKPNATTVSSALPAPNEVCPVAQGDDPPMAALCPPDGPQPPSTSPTVSSPTASPSPPLAKSNIAMPTLSPLPQMRSEHFRMMQGDSSTASPRDHPVRKRRPKVTVSLTEPEGTPSPLGPTTPLTPHDPEAPAPAPRRKPKLNADKLPPGSLTNRRTVRKKPALACLFCRERKIACGPPAPDDENQTCSQCAKRDRKCEMPEKSRRGQYQRSQREARGRGSLVLPNDPQPQPVASTSTST